MTRTIAHRELRNDSSRVLREVQAGETFEITNHGEVVAILMPPGDLPPLTVRPASNPEPFDLVGAVRLDHPVQVTLDELRGDR